MVSPHFPLPKGGIEVHVRGLSRNLVQRGHNVVMVTPAPKNVHLDFKGAEVFGIKSFNLPGWPYYSLKSFNVPYNMGSFVSQVKKLMSKREIDVVHAQGQKYLYTSVAVSLSRMAKVPSVLTIHGTYGLRYFGYIGKFIEETFNRVVLAQTIQSASVVICCTQMEADYARQYCEDFECFTIPNGIDIHPFLDALKHKDEFREEYDIPLDKKVILFLGGLIARKGVPELLDAVGRVTKSFPEALFLIVGDGLLWREVEQCAATQSAVRAYRWVPESEKHKLYALSDVFILPSKSEGQPITLLEAMASQLHIVTTPVGGVSETLAGYESKTYIKRSSPAEIVSGISEALRSVSKGKVVNSKSFSGIKKFDWANVTMETEKVYNHVLHT